MDAKRVAEAIKKRPINRNSIMTSVLDPKSSEPMPLCGLPRGKRCCCRVVGCNMCQLWYSQVSLFNFPQDEVRLKKWLQLVGREDLKPKYNIDFVCEIHFERKYITEHSFSKHLNRFCLPTLNLPVPNQNGAQKSLSAVDKHIKKRYLDKSVQTSPSKMYSTEEEDILERKEFHELCHIFLPEKLAEQVQSLTSV